MHLRYLLYFAISSMTVLYSTAIFSMNSRRRISEQEEAEVFIMA